MATIAIVKLIRDNREEVSEFLAEILEDIAMKGAIAEGEAIELVSRECIFQLLDRQLCNLNVRHYLLSATQKTKTWSLQGNFWCLGGENDRTISRFNPTLCLLNYFWRIFRFGIGWFFFVRYLRTK